MTYHNWIMLVAFVAPLIALARELGSYVGNECHPQEDEDGTWHEG